MVMSEFEGLAHMTPEAFIELKARAEAAEAEVRRLTALWEPEVVGKLRERAETAEARVSVLEGILDRAHEIVLTRDARVAELEAAEHVLRCRICNAELGQPHTRCVYSSIIVGAHETHEPSLASAFGAWPGEETDEELPNDGD